MVVELAGDGRKETENVVVHCEQADNCDDGDAGGGDGSGGDEYKGNGSDDHGRNDDVASAAVSKRKAPPIIQPLTATNACPESFDTSSNACRIRT